MSIWPQAMSYLRPSSEVDFVRPVIACFVDVYAVESGRGACAEIEPLLMMRPPRGSWSFMILKASCVHTKLPVRLVSTTWRQRSTLQAFDWPAGPEAGVVEQQVQSPEAFLRGGEQRPDLVDIPHVRRHCQALGAGRQHADRLFQSFQQDQRNQ